MLRAPGLQSKYRIPDAIMRKYLSLSSLLLIYISLQKTRHAS